MKTGAEKPDKAMSKHHRIKHHGKLFTLIISKLIFAFIAFVIGLYIGNLISKPPLLIIIAGLVAIVLYLLSVLHIVDWLEI